MTCDETNETLSCMVCKVPLKTALKRSSLCGLGSDSIFEIKHMTHQVMLTAAMSGAAILVTKISK
jgi:hypothetical protein